MKFDTTLICCASFVVGALHGWVAIALFAVLLFTAAAVDARKGKE